MRLSAVALAFLGAAGCLQAPSAPDEGTWSPVVVLEHDKIIWGLDVEGDTLVWDEYDVEAKAHRTVLQEGTTRQILLEGPPIQPTYFLDGSVWMSRQPGTGNRTWTWAPEAGLVERTPDPRMTLVGHWGEETLHIQGWNGSGDLDFAIHLVGPNGSVRPLPVSPALAPISMVGSHRGGPDEPERDDLLIVVADVGGREQSTIHSVPRNGAPVSRLLQVPYRVHRLEVEGDIMVYARSRDDLHSLAVHDLSTGNEMLFFRPTSDQWHIEGTWVTAYDEGPLPETGWEPDKKWLWAYDTATGEYHEWAVDVPGSAGPAVAYDGGAWYVALKRQPDPTGPGASTVYRLEVQVPKPQGR